MFFKRDMFPLVLLFLFSSALVCSCLLADKAPDWLMQAASLEHSEFGRDVDAVVLLNHQQVTVDSNGELTTIHRYAAKFLGTKVNHAAVASVLYRTDSDQVKYLKAWLIKSSGNIKEFEKEDLLDIAMDQDDLYNESRKKIISATSEIGPGMVFGYESKVESRSLFCQSEWYFQDSLPVVQSVYELILPDGGSAQSLTLNHQEIRVENRGNARLWKLLNLPPIPIEPMSPPLTYLVPRLLVSWSAPKLPCLSFSSWSEVSSWLTGLNDSQMQESEALIEKAASLSLNHSIMVNKIRAIAEFVQDLNYVSVQIGLGRGGGYTPRPASKIFASSFGDCKDKVNLLRTMLKTIGIQSFPIAVFAGDPNYVHEKWPSPYQFNHYILGIQLDDDYQCESLFKHPIFGNLIVFDPTDSLVPLGCLPRHEQGGLGLVLAGDRGSLIRLPLSSSADNHNNRTIVANLDENGGLLADIEENSFGGPAVSERRLLRQGSESEYRNIIKGWILRGAFGAVVSKIEPTDHWISNQFHLKVEMKAQQYGQVIQDQLMIFQPAIVERRESGLPTSLERVNPIAISSRIFGERVTIKLPETFAVDEMPDSVQLTEEFGSYRANFLVEDNCLHFERELNLSAAIIPASEYENVKSFFEEIRDVEQTPVVLVKK